MIPLPKPNKARGPVANLRPIVLLNTLRKVISLVVLKRITPRVSHYLGSTSSGFRPGRGTADVVWTQRWISAKATHFVWDCHVLGLDMSKAFDTISRTKLLAVMSEITGPDKVCLIHHLLYGTTLSVKVGATSAEAFVSTLGTPQGDGLSPVLFVCYLEAALRETRSKLPPRPDTDAAIPQETGYADDISFYSTERQWLANSLPVKADGLGDWSLNVNSSKTEWLHISDSTTEWRRSKQLGSLLGEEEDLSRRMDQASTSYGRMYSLWIRRQLVSEETRLRLYNAIVLPTLLYNCETWRLTKAALKKLNAFHRRQLRNLFGIRYPAIISNKDLYSRAHTQPLSHTVAVRRFRMLGHVLRMPSDAPPQQAMDNYFRRDVTGVRGRPKSNLATAVKASTAARDMPLKTMTDLSGLIMRALDKQSWRELSA